MTPQPHPVFALSDRFVDELAAASPLSATAHGIAGHDHELDDRSPDGVAALADLLRRTRDELAALPLATHRDARLAVAVLDAYLTEELDRHGRGTHRRDISHMANWLSDARDIIDAQDRSDDGWRAVAERLRGMPPFVEGWQSTVREGLDSGDVVAARQVRSVIDQLRASVGPEGTYARIASGYDGDDDRIATALRDGLAGTSDANHAAADWLEQTYLPRAADHDGVGRERYTVEARDHVGTDLDLDETYAWAWDVVRDLRQRMIGVAAEIDPDADLAAVVHGVKTDPAGAVPPDEFARLMLERQHHAIRLLDGTHVDVPEQIREVEVRLAAPGAPLGAWYLGPSEDFRRPGSIWWSLGNRTVVPLWDEVSTAYHEGFPGHHMQIGLAATMRDRLSRVHRSGVYWKPGAGEGWALYAERLMDELGFLDEPRYVLGYLAGSMLRACRVVVDIGCHLGLDVPEDAPFHPGEAWRYDLAVEMLTDYAFLDRDYAESEVTRYLGWPGQAIAYKVGEQAIVDLREQLRRTHGPAFDLKAFHADVLGAGAVGLDLLARVVRGDLD